MAATGAPIRVPVAVACRVLGLSTQGYYKWLKDPVCQRDWDDAHLIDVLYDLHADDATLGYRFLTDELDLEHGITVGENRVHRLCRIAGITASHHKKRSKAGSTGPAPHDDLLAVVDEHGVVRHEFVADEPNKVWLWDISEHPTREGKLYICAIKDVFSNKIVGYSIDTRMKSSLARAAMRNAIALRSSTGTVCHSDRGGQFQAGGYPSKTEKSAEIAAGSRKPPTNGSLPWRDDTSPGRSDVRRARCSSHAAHGWFRPWPCPCRAERPARG